MADAIILHPRAKDLTGLTFGRLVANKPIGRQGNKIVWECTCVCGNTSTARGIDLTSGRRKSCGCSRGSGGNALTYLRGTHTHTIWRGMRSRCNNKSHDSYKYYGGKGIKVCERWSSFRNFISDMGIIPEGMSLERLDNNVGYCPDNCTIIPLSDQWKNKSNVKR